MARLRAPLLARPCHELSGSEMARIFTALGQESLYAQVFFLFCIVCGASTASVKTLLWTDLEPGDDTREVEPRDTTAIAMTSDRRDMTVSHFSPILLRRLYRLPRRGPFVFYPHREDGCYWSPETARLNWGRVCARASVPGLKLNDVRYTWSKWTARQDIQCRQLEALLDRATVQMYQAAQPPVPMKTTHVVPMTRKMEMRRTLHPLQRNRPPLKTDWPG